MCYDDALYKFTVYLLTYICYKVRFKHWIHRQTDSKLPITHYAPH